MGLPEFYGVSLPACHGLMTPADLHILAKTDASVLSSVNAKTLDVRNCYFEAVPDRVRGSLKKAPVCPQNRAYGSVHGSSCYLYPLIKVEPPVVMFV